MTISNTTNEIQATGDGVTTVFPFPFRVFDPTQLEVIQITPAGSIINTFVLNTDYTVSINPVAEGGSVDWTVAPAAGNVSQITRIVPYTQSVILLTEGAFPAQQVENQLDLLTMMVIQLQGLVAQFTVNPSGKSSYISTFANSSLVSGILTVAHNLGQPAVVVQIYNNVSQLVIPDQITLISPSSLTVNLLSLGAITGTWTVIVSV